MIGERLSDGETEATLTWVLTANDTPALFVGKSWPERLTTVTAEITEAVYLDWADNNNTNVNDLSGKDCLHSKVLSKRNQWMKSAHLMSRDAKRLLGN